MSNQEFIAVQQRYARCRLNTYGRRAFSVVGPAVWNSPGFHPGPDHQCRVFLTFA